MKRRLLAALLVPTAIGAQEVVLREPGPERVASIVRGAAAAPHVLRAGDGDLVLRRDTVIDTNLLVIGRRTYLGAHVRGDVVVIGGDLFLRPGVNVDGRAVAIGGAVYPTMLGHVDGEVRSFRDDGYAIAATPGRIELTYAGRRPDAPPLLQGAGVQGLLLPSYDRVDGLSLPVGALVTLGQRVVEIQPTITYRSRLGTIDPGVVVRIAPERAVRFEADAGRSTRTNDAWIYSDLVNSAAALALGSDTRNYFRATGGTARLIGHVESPTLVLEPFVGGRYEEVRPIAAVGNVFSFSGRTSVEHMARPNPLVEPGIITSALAGASLEYDADPVRGRLRGEVERGLRAPAGTSTFTQLTLDGRIEFPTFGQQRLRFDAHAVTTSGDAVPMARWAWLGRGGTLPLLELLEQGGDELLFVESRYEIPISAIVIPKAGSPTLFVRHLMGSAGVGSLPSLEQEIGAGVGLSVLRFDVTVDAAGDRDTRVGVGLSIAR
jgi:hypothetical protein